MKNIKKIFKYLLLPLTLIGMAINFLMKSNLDGAKKDIEEAETFEDKTKKEIKQLKDKENNAIIKEERMKAKLEIIEESSDTDWYKKE